MACPAAPVSVTPNEMLTLDLCNVHNARLMSHG